MYGHSMGDKVLYEVGRVLKEETRGKDIIGRYGGDEFVALIVDANDMVKSEEIISRIKERISKICTEMGLEVNVTASIGLSYTSQTGFDYRRLKEIADDRLYIAKKSGKDKIVKIS
jgi:diguanylate cyclase (GGDEF)-like protein